MVAVASKEPLVGNFTNTGDGTSALEPLVKTAVAGALLAFWDTRERSTESWILLAGIPIILLRGLVQEGSKDFSSSPLLRAVARESKPARIDPQAD